MSVIEVEHLSKAYGGRTVVDGISFAVERGEIFGIVGPNGAGKTVTVETIEGLRTPDGGRVHVLGMDPIEDRAEVTQVLGAQLQESRLQDKIRVGEAVSLYASFYDDPQDPADLLERLGLGDKLDARYRDLSGGQKQRVSVALALVGSPQIAVLDELTTGLDPQARRDMWDTIAGIRDDGVTVVLVTHFMDEAERLCDRIMVVESGHVAALDSPDGLVSHTGGGTSMRFRPEPEIDDDMLLSLEEVDAVDHRGTQVVLSGHGNVVHAVTSMLASQRVIAHELRVGQPTLEDAYLTITGGNGNGDGTGTEVTP